jgi:hypothetical protein
VATVVFHNDRCPPRDGPRPADGIVSLAVGDAHERPEARHEAALRRSRRARSVKGTLATARATALGPGVSGAYPPSSTNALGGSEPLKGDERNWLREA